MPFEDVVTHEVRLVMIEQDALMGGYFLAISGPNPPDIVTCKVVSGRGLMNRSSVLSVTPRRPIRAPESNLESGSSSERAVRHERWRVGQGSGFLLCQGEGESSIFPLAELVRLVTVTSC